LNDKVGIATSGKKQSVRGFMQVSGHAQVAKLLDILSIIRLDYPLDIADTPSSDTG
jgi:hypothetical protein